MTQVRTGCEAKEPPYTNGNASKFKLTTMDKLAAARKQGDDYSDTTRAEG
jgi:hypothetical protein